MHAVVLQIVCVLVIIAAVVGLLVAFLLRMDDASFGQACLIAIAGLELVVAVENVTVPSSAIMDDFQTVDIPLKCVRS